MHVPCKEGPLSSAETSLHRRKAGERGNESARGKMGRRRFDLFVQLRRLTMHVEHDIAAMQ